MSEMNHTRRENDWTLVLWKHLSLLITTPKNWQTKRQILSLFVNDFSKTDLQEIIPGLSKWPIDQARRHAIDVGEG